MSVDLDLSCNTSLQDCEIAGVTKAMKLWRQNPSLARAIFLGESPSTQREWDRTNVYPAFPKEVEKEHKFDARSKLLEKFSTNLLEQSIRINAAIFSARHSRGRRKYNAKDGVHRIAELLKLVDRGLPPNERVTVLCFGYKTLEAAVEAAAGVMQDTSFAQPSDAVDLFESVNFGRFKFYKLPHPTGENWTAEEENFWERVNLLNELVEG